MVRALLVNCGTRGDSEPFLALGTALANRSDFEHVTLILPEEHVILAPNIANLETVGAKLDMREGVNAAKETADTIALMGQYMAELVLPAYGEVLEKMSGMCMDVVICGLPTLPLGVLAASIFGTPLIFVQLQPLTPSARYPQVFRAPCETAAAFAGGLADKLAPNTLDTHREVARTLLAPSAAPLHALASRHGVPPPTVTDLLAAYESETNGMYVLLAYCGVLAPLRGAGRNTAIASALAADYIPPGWPPSAGLVRFLSDGDPPAALAYGSMPPPDLVEVVRGLRAAGMRRVVIVGHQNSAFDDDEDIYMARDVQYAWLFPRVHLVLSSGGAGTVAAAVAAGKPLIVMPVMLDQPFWATLVEARGCGIHIADVLSESKISHAVQRLREMEAWEKVLTLSKQVPANASTSAAHTVRKFIDAYSR